MIIRSVNSHCRRNYRCIQCPIRSKMFCNFLTNDDLKELSGKVKHKSYTKGLTVLEKGTDVNHIYNIIEGNVKIYQLDSDGEVHIGGAKFLLN